MVVAPSLGQLPDSREGLVKELSQMLGEELSRLSKAELYERNKRRNAWEQGLPPRAEIESEIIQDEISGKTAGQLRVAVATRVRADPLRTLVDVSGCVPPLGFSFCKKLNRCVQNC
jgi:hypothetical protein